MDKEKKALVVVEQQFNKLAKMAEAIDIDGNPSDFLPYTDEELENIKKENKLVDKIEEIHIRADKMYKKK